MPTLFVRVKIAKSKFKTHSEGEYFLHISVTVFRLNYQRLELWSSDPCCKMDGHVFTVWPDEFVKKSPKM
jgi:hypothetical protein